MITIDEILSDENLSIAFEHYAKRKDSRGPDGMPLTALKQYWEMNQAWLVQELREGSYQPGIIKSYEILNGKGKRRTVYNLNTIDRFISRLLAQKMKEAFEPAFLSSSYAYREGKSPQMAVMQAVKYIGEGNRYIAEIDLQDFFDQIPLDALLRILKKKVSDQSVTTLIEKYLYCSVINDNGVLEQRNRGLIQGNPMSPVLSNLYLNQFDQYMECRKYRWIRFADNVNIYMRTQELAAEAFGELNKYLYEELHMTVNRNKSGIYDAFTRRFLGYEFSKRKDEIQVKKHQYNQPEYYSSWHKSSVERVNREYHIVQDGILNKHDYALLFENEEEKHHIPVEALDQINIYGNVTVSPQVLNLLSREKIRLAYMNKHGELMGYYIPEGYAQSALTLLRQCEKYSDEKQRASIARAMELAGLHNMRANLRYYYKKKKELASPIEKMTQYYESMKSETSVEKMLLIEARAKQTYYESFRCIIEPEGFLFIRRTRRPPEDPINALISFGNTVLYNRILSMLWKTSLDPRISVVHAANRRAHSLNLDFADIFKPVIVDRVIFSLINCKRLRGNTHFCTAEEGGIYLNEDGKRIFLREFERKMNARFYAKDKVYTYHLLIEQELQKYLRYVLRDETYKPYKYY